MAKTQAARDLARKTTLVRIGLPVLNLMKTLARKNRRTVKAEMEGILLDAFKKTRNSR